MKATFVIRGMNCGNCRRKVSDAISGVAGVEGVVVDLASGLAEVEYQNLRPEVPGNVEASVRSAGFGISVKSGKISGGFGGFSWGVNGLLAVLAWLVLLGIGHFSGGSKEGLFLIALIGSLGQVFCGWRFYVGAVRRIVELKADMDVLVSLGSSAAYLFSMWLLFSGKRDGGGHLFFSEGMAILGFISLGHWMEERVSRKAEASLQLLMAAVPSKARRQSINGEFVECRVDQLRIGDRVQIVAGETVPTDCKVVQGRGMVDESVLTGESMPVSKGAGDLSWGGSINGNSVLICDVVAVGKDTAVAQIIQSVRQSQASRARIQKLADSVSNVFVPGVVLIAFGAATAWYFGYETMKGWSMALGGLLWTPGVNLDPIAAAVEAFCSVLIVACPCAMGLATPAAIVAGTNAGARIGILVRSARALEMAGEVTHVLFDKTATLTEGKPKVERVFGSGVYVQNGNADGGLNLDKARRFSAIGAMTGHPIGKTIADWGGRQERVGEFRSVVEHPGFGIEALSESEVKIRLGSLRWLTEQGIPIEDLASSFVVSEDKKGVSLTGLSEGSDLVAIFSVRDVPKMGAREMLQSLRGKGLKVGLLTGDNLDAARLVGEELGFEPNEIRSGLKPEEKAQEIARLQAEGWRVAFVGDGINDGPALAKADLGIAVARANAVASQASGFVLLNADVDRVPEVIELAGKVVRIIRQNLFWAFFYNAAAVPLAVFGLLHPMVCAAAMGISDVIVVGNSLRLLRWRRKGS